MIWIYDWGWAEFKKSALQARRDDEGWVKLSWFWLKILDAHLWWVIDTIPSQHGWLMYGLIQYAFMWAILENDRRAQRNWGLGSHRLATGHGRQVRGWSKDGDNLRQSSGENQRYLVDKIEMVQSLVFVLLKRFFVCPIVVLLTLLR